MNVGPGTDGLTSRTFRGVTGVAGVSFSPTEGGVCL